MACPSRPYRTASARNRRSQTPGDRDPGRTLRPVRRSARSTLVDLQPYTGLPWLVKSSRVVANAVFGEKRLEGRPDVFFALDLNRLEIRFLDLREVLDHAAAV